MTGRRAWANFRPYWASDSLTKRFGELLARTQAEGRSPSVTAAVSQAGETAWACPVGLSQVAGEHEASPAHQYRIGSITKLFTAVAVMQLRDEGLIGVTGQLSCYLPQSPPELAALRVTDLLAHLPGMQREPPGQIWTSHSGPDVKELYAQIEHAEVVLTPGTRWHYWNLAYGLLGELVSRVRRAPYRRVVSERILDPLGLAHTSWEARAPVAQGYVVGPFSDHVSAAEDMDLRSLSGLGQLWSTVGDVGRWGCFLGGATPAPEVLSRQSLEKMHLPRALLDSRWDVASGLGPKLYRHGGRVFGGHGGSMPGFLAIVAYSLRDGVCATIMANASSGPDLRSLALDLCTHAGDAARRMSPWRPGLPPPPAIAALLGRWWCGGEEVVVRWRQGLLEVSDPSDPGAEVAKLTPDGPDLYRATSGPQLGERLEIRRAPDAEVVGLRFATYQYQRGHTGNGTKGPAP